MNGIPHYMPCNAARIGKTDLIAHCKGGWNGRHDSMLPGTAAGTKYAWRPRAAVPYHHDGWTSACHRQYVGTWAIVDGMLRLVAFSTH